MIRDQNKFTSLNKEKGGSVTFGDNSFSKIVGKGTVSLGNEKDKDDNVLCVEHLKNDLLSVIQMCDQGHTCIFNF